MNENESARVEETRIGTEKETEIAIVIVTRGTGTGTETETGTVIAVVKETGTETVAEIEIEEAEAETGQGHDPDHDREDVPGREADRDQEVAAEVAEETKERRESKLLSQTNCVIDSKICCVPSVSRE